MGIDPYYPAPPINCDIKSISSEIEKFSNCNEPILIEDRGTLHGGNLFELILQLNQSRTALGIGTDINLPNLAVGIAMNKYLGMEKLVQIGFGCAHDISKGIFPGIKVVSAINLLSVLSPEQAREVIEASTKSSNKGDLIVIYTMDCSPCNLKNNAAKGEWKKKIYPEPGVEAFQQNYEYDISDLERAGLPTTWKFKLGNSGTDADKSTKVIQNLTFYRKNTMINLLENNGFIIESTKQIKDKDDMQRLMILARKR